MAGQSLHITGGSVFDGTRWQRDSDLIIENGMVVATVPSGGLPRCAAVLDACGRIVLPGLVDAHLHLFPGFISRLPAFGITAAVDMFSTPNVLDVVRAEIRRYENCAHWVSAGIGASVAGGHPRQLIGQGLYEAFPSLDSRDDISRFIDARLDEGSAFIKIFLENGRVADHALPVPDADTVRAVCDSARRRGVLVVAHVTDPTNALIAVRSGVDVLAHTVVPEPGETTCGELVRELAGRGVAVIPTLVAIGSALGVGHTDLFADTVAGRINEAWKAHARRLGRDSPRFDSWERAREFVAELIGAGVSLMAGTDAAFPGVVPGASLHAELELLRSCGLDGDALLAAATSTPGARFFGGGVGYLRPGCVGDAVIVDDLLTQSIDTQRLRAVVIAGHVVTSQIG